MKQLKRLLRYLSGTRPKGLIYDILSTDNADEVFSHSDWAAYTTRRTQSVAVGEVVKLNGGGV
jgi:hypothetical protein